MNSRDFTQLSLTVLIFALQKVALESFAAHDFATSTFAESLRSSAARLELRHGTSLEMNFAVFNTTTPFLA